ncbi:hypothetical protein LCGC14_0630380 [marine sediment metagenome]|uniref:Uncharacterized protein n=1 Tax=marine sediment metagenome TaxID=412755 RepID=A0A0F9R7E3_9ZZZZ
MIASRQRTVSEYYLAGLTIVMIAERLSLSLATISKDLKTLKQLWASENIRLRERYVKRELARLSNLEQYAIEHLAEPEEIFNATGDLVSGPNPVKFIQAMLKIIKRRSMLLGLDAPIRLELDATQGSEDIVARSATMSDLEIKMVLKRSLTIRAQLSKGTKSKNVIDISPSQSI